MIFRPQQINTAFRERGLAVREERPQFLLSMVLRRWNDRADRRAPSA